jgi:hypothetical protein
MVAMLFSFVRTPSLLSLSLQQVSQERTITIVKILASILVCVIVLHGACMARCTGEQSRITLPAAVPPCHHPDGSPERNDSPLRSNACSEGPALEAKTFPTLRCSLETAGLPDLALVGDSIKHEVPFEAYEIKSSQGSVLLARHSVLRI